MAFESNGNLRSGFHDWSMAEIEKNLVTDFPSSTTRAINFQGYRRLVQILLATGLSVEQWLDGSFSTTKIDPNDIDLLSIADKDIVDRLPQNVQQQLLALFQGPGTKPSFCCDSYFLAKVPAAHPDYEAFRQKRKYWMGEFGYDRTDQPKGIVRTMI